MSNDLTTQPTKKPQAEKSAKGAIHHLRQLLKEGMERLHQAADVAAELRVEHGLKVAQIAGEVGVSKGTISKLLRWRDEGFPGSPFTLANKQTKAIPAPAPAPEKQPRVKLGKHEIDVGELSPAAQAQLAEATEHREEYISHASEAVAQAMVLVQLMDDASLAAFDELYQKYVHEKIEAPAATESHPIAADPAAGPSSRQQQGEITVEDRRAQMAAFVAEEEGAI